jgi:hypothetical protein
MGSSSLEIGLLASSDCHLLTPGFIWGLDEPHQRCIGSSLFHSAYGSHVPWLVVQGWGEGGEGGVQGNGATVGLASLLEPEYPLPMTRDLSVVFLLPELRVKYYHVH